MWGIGRQIEWKIDDWTTIITIKTTTKNRISRERNNNNNNKHYSYTKYIRQILFNAMLYFLLWFFLRVELFFFFTHVQISQIVTLYALLMPASMRASSRTQARSNVWGSFNSLIGWRFYCCCYFTSRCYALRCMFSFEYE